MAGILNEDEKVKIRHHMGYLNVQESQTFILGIPAGVQTQFIIEGAMDKVLERALPMIRRHIGVLDGIEDQMIGDLELLAIEQIDTIKVRGDEQDKLKDQYLYWQRGLGNLLGVEANPFDRRFANSGLNVTVNH